MLPSRRRLLQYATNFLKYSICCSLLWKLYFVWSMKPKFLLHSSTIFRISNAHRRTLGSSLPAMQKTWVWSLGWEDPLEEGMTTHSSILAWRILWAEEPERLQSMGLTKESDMTEQLNTQDVPNSKFYIFALIGIFQFTFFLITL